MLRIPFAAVVLNQAESVRLLPRAMGQVPAYGYPEAAVGALARAVGYGAWRAEPRGHVPDFAGIRVEDARTLVREFLHVAPDGGWLDPKQVAELLRCYGIPLADLAPPGIEVTIKVADDRRSSDWFRRASAARERGIASD